MGRVANIAHAARLLLNAAKGRGKLSLLPQHDGLQVALRPVCDDIEAEAVFYVKLVH